MNLTSYKIRKQIKSGMQDCYEFFEWGARAIEVIKSESTENWISINFPQINPVKNGEW